MDMFFNCPAKAKHLFLKKLYIPAFFADFYLKYMLYQMKDDT